MRPRRAKTCGRTFSLTCCLQEHAHPRGLFGLVRNYNDEIAPVLADKIGCFLFQFPPSYRYTAPRLKSIVTQLDPAYRNVVEFRHRSWWRDSVYEALAERGISFCVVSAPRLPETCPAQQRLLYVRFSGRTQWYRHDYSREELAVWAERIQTSGAEEVWVYFNNDRNGHAVKNALMLRRMLRSSHE
jgi:uncharacterized protein YecE (DUF72 family)